MIQRAKVNHILGKKKHSDSYSSDIKPNSFEKHKERGRFNFSDDSYESDGGERVFFNLPSEVSADDSNISSDSDTKKLSSNSNEGYKTGTTKIENGKSMPNSESLQSTPGKLAKFQEKSGGAMMAVGSALNLGTIIGDTVLCFTRVKKMIPTNIYMEKKHRLLPDSLETNVLQQRLYNWPLPLQVLDLAWR